MSDMPPGDMSWSMTFDTMDMLPQPFLHEGFTQEPGEMDQVPLESVEMSSDVFPYWLGNSQAMVTPRGSCSSGSFSSENSPTILPSAGYNGVAHSHVMFTPPAEEAPQCVSPQATLFDPDSSGFAYNHIAAQYPLPSPGSPTPYASIELLLHTNPPPAVAQDLASENQWIELSPTQSPRPPPQDQRPLPQQFSNLSLDSLNVARMGQYIASRDEIELPGHAQQPQVQPLEDLLCGPPSSPARTSSWLSMAKKPKYACDVCGKTFNDHSGRTTLSRHKKYGATTGPCEKPKIPCRYPGCKKKFQRIDALRNHQHNKHK